MKKLLTMLSAATVALGLYAYDDTGTSFEGVELGGAPSVEFNIATPDDIQTNGVDVTGLWATNGTVQLTVVSGQSVVNSAPPRPGQYTEGSIGVKQYLSVQSSFGADNIVMRNILADGVPLAIGEDKRFYFDSLVKFTAFEAGGMPQSVTNEMDAAKIAVWIETNEDETRTNLYVRAGQFDSQGTFLGAQTYNCGTFDDADAWHRLTIKFIENISQDGDNPVPAFMVFVDGSDSGGNAVTISEGSPNPGTIPGTIASKWADIYGSRGNIFPSICQSGQRTSLTSVSFDGTGYIDDIVFTATAPGFAEDPAVVTIEWDTSKIASLQINGTPYSEGSAIVNYAESITVDNIVYASDYTGPSSVTIPFAAEGDTDDTTLNALAKDVVATFDNVKYASLDAAIDAAYAETEDDDKVLKLVKTTDQNNITISNATRRIVINLNGQTIGSIRPTAGTRIKITGDGTVTGQAFDEYAGVSEIAGGTYDAYVELPNGSTISGGKFLMSANTTLLVDAVNCGYLFPEGMKLAQGTGDDSLYYVLQEIQETPVAQIGDTKYTSLKAAVDAATAGQTVTVLADCEVTEPITFTKGITVSNDYVVTVANAGNSITYAYRVINGTSTPVTLCGTGTFTESGTPSGSQFLVGFTKTRYETAATAGSLVLDGCTVTNGQSNVIKVENGTFTMNSGTIDAAALRAVKADGEDGANSATLTINGGTINSSTKAVAVSSQADGGAASATINGGTIAGPVTDEAPAVALSSITIPGTSTARFSAQPAAGFVEAGYKTVLSDGWYVVTAKEYYTAISLNKATTSLVTNETETLVATLTPASAADDSVTWTTSDATVATVENGVVTAVGAGTATITAATANYSATCTVTVTAPSVGPTIDPANPSPAEVVAESAAAAIEAVAIETPTGVDAAKYKELFNIVATEKAGTPGTYEVEVTGLKESVKTDVNEDAIDVLEGASDAGVTVPAGLFYKITTMTELGGTPVNTYGDGSTRSTGAKQNIVKPGTTKGFIKIELDAAEIK